MKNLLMVILLVAANQSFAKTAKKAAPTAPATNSFSQNFHSAAFSDVHVSASQELELHANETYLKAGSQQRKIWVTEAVTGWQASQNQKTDQMATVVWNGGGELWTVQGNNVSQVTEWSENRLFIPETTPPSGRLFAFFGGQVTTGGPADISGFNARVGSTLLQNRYDVALSFSAASVNTTPSVNTNSIGIVGRALFPLSEHVGYNLGGQLVMTQIDGNSQSTPGAVAGLNFFMPNGSFDVTLSAIDAGRWSLLAGYTLFFERH
jgi:hypothetical protein